ncbi:SUF system NifU family Fe-S cluster assembly protein [Thermoleptolyngbya sichuanensis A183]|uniref:SUF system NifU family Fe-S cluster assembly protein n=1 Tax=Thermoleptolyngbya sichuanensis A183 TaxID=2737172 RepID=A0A6M8B1S5_9CYAN|nr:MULTISPECIES: SUF system NifU family Fe-S cluster assembly protein [Thermoleptolyngbya]QKD80969.1 SUF system NifU family Fe-S cluster assembly protein [Thermoleptolyngbya sichuanensis A183]
MSLDNLRDLYQQVILERYKKPRYKGKTDPIDRYQKGHNPSCGDTIELTLHLEDDPQGDPSVKRISDVKFEGEGCAISMASADLMAEALRGKTTDEALEMVQKFQAMMRGEAEFPADLRKLNVMQGVAQFPVRIKCANLSWHTLKAALEAAQSEQPEFVSNEAEG